MFGLGNSEKFVLLAQLHNAAYLRCSYINMGPDLLYLTAAIVRDGIVEVSQDSKIVELINEEFKRSSPIWNYIKQEVTVLCVGCKQEILLEDASFCESLNGWLGHTCCSKVN